MKSPILILASALAGSLALSSAYAADVAGTALLPTQAATSVNPNGDLNRVVVSRAQVKAETREAERLGLIPRGEARLAHPDYALPSTLSRAQVKSETRLAEAAGLIPRGEEAFPAVSFSAPSTLSRAEVKAEARLAEARGEIPRGQSNLTRE